MEEWDDQRSSDRRKYGSSYRGIYAAESYHNTTTVDQNAPTRELGDGHKAIGTIDEAIIAAGAFKCPQCPRVIILPGLYHEQLIVENPVELIGGGACVAHVVIQGTPNMFEMTHSGTLLKWKVG